MNNERKPWSDDKTYAEAARIKIIQLEKRIKELEEQVFELTSVVIRNIGKNI
jgi:hypothetical protein